MFQSVDVDNGGTLDVEEVRQLGEKLGCMFTEKELQAAMTSMGEDGSGEVDFNEFYEWWLVRKRSGDYDLHSEAVEMFQAVDADGGGTLDIEEVRQVGVRLNFDFHQSELETAFQQMDVDGSGAVDFGEFYKWWSVRKQRGDHHLHNAAVAMFNTVDADKSGTLEIQEVNKLGAMLGFNFTTAELNAAMADMDKDGSGAVDFQEFYAWFSIRKQRGNPIRVGNKMRCVSVHAEVLAIKSRLVGANESGDPSELLAAIRAAKSVFIKAPAPADIQLLMNELEEKLSGADNDLERRSMLRASRPIRAKILRLWDLMTCESAMIGLKSDPPVIVEVGQCTLQGYQQMHIRLSRVLQDVENTEVDAAYEYQQLLALANEDWEEDCARFSEASHIILWIDGLRKKFRRASKQSVAIHGFKSVFDRHDYDGSGALDLAEFTTVIRTDMGISEQSISAKDISSMFTAVDGDASGEVDAAEFVHWLWSDRGALKGQKSKAVADNRRNTIGGGRRGLNQLKKRFKKLASEVNKF